MLEDDRSLFSRKWKENGKRIVSNVKESGSYKFYKKDKQKIRKKNK